jgi:hypothetical protein
MHMRAVRLSSVLGICVFVLCLSSLSSAQATCTLSTTNRTVTICTPASNSTVGTTFHVNAGTTSSLPIAYMQVYVNYVLYATQKRNFLDATITVPAGTHQHFTVQAKDSSGVFFKTTYYINVAASTYSIAPLNPTLAQGATQQFTASQASTWSASCGSISSGGLYTAPNAQTSCTVTGTASDGSGKTASTSVTVSSAFTVSPTTASVSEGATQQFTASLGATWGASCGSVDGTGLFTAPLTPGSCTVTATSTDGSNRTASGTATVTSPISITPASATTAVGLTQQFSANAAVNWSASCGSIDSTGLFTAPATAGSCTITATASNAPAYTATAVDTVSNSYVVSPQNPTVGEGASQQFSANIASTWASSCGSIDNNGVFTAPFSQPTCQVTGTATDGSNATSSTNVTISSPITVTPSSATTAANQTQSFSANQAVTWSASCGSIDINGLFTAPGTAGSCTITATASSGQPYTATALDTVTGGSSSGINYTTWKNNNARDGWQPNETQLTPANVGSSNFGLAFTTTVDARVWAQPLYMSGVTINAAKHNVVYVATAKDSVYALDGDTGAQLWMKSLLGSGETPATGSTIHSNVQPIVGITGTPVIDPNSGALYAVTLSTDGAGNYFHRLHAIDIHNGTELFGGPVQINPPTWRADREGQRPGLLLSNGVVYVAFGGNDDVDPYHGYVIGYAADSLNQVAIFNDSPSGNKGGIWMGGSGLAADADGNILVSTGNGSWTGTTQYGQSIVKLDPSLNVTDYFTPIAHAAETNSDKDLGSGGVLILPDNNSAHPHEAINCSKLTIIYVLDRDNMGRLGSGTDNVVQQVSNQIGGATGTQAADKCFHTPAFWNNNLYFIGNNDVVKQFSFDPSTGLMGTTPAHQSATVYPFPGGQPVVSSNGNSNAIVWGFNYSAGTLNAYDATNVSNVLYTSAKVGSGVKWATPTVVNGHVYVGLVNAVAGFAVKTSSGTDCNPPASPGVNICAPTAGGSYPSPVTVSAAGTPASGTLARMELWIDGAKFANYFANHFTASVPLAVGSHTIGVHEVDSTGAYLKQAFTITVH